MTDEFLQRFEERRLARQQAERSFDIAGVTLTYRPTVAPEVAMRLERSRIAYLEQLITLEEEQKKVAEAREKNGGDDIDMAALLAAAEAVTPDWELIQVAEETVMDCLTSDSQEAWAALRSPQSDQPLTYDEVFEIADFLLGKVAGIPTAAPVDSSDGRTETAKPSKAKSSSPATVPTG